MRENNKTKTQLVNELAELRQRIAKLKETETEHKRAEKEIRQQKDFLENTIESLTHPFYVVDTNDYRIIVANSEAKKLCNFSDNITCYSLAHRTNTPCDGIEHPCPLTEMKKTKQPITVEHIHYDKEGNPREVEVHADPILDNEGNVVQMIEYTLDITRRKQTEELARKLVTAVETMQLGVTITNLDGKIVYTNPAEAEMHGYRVEELLGKDVGIFAPPKFRKLRSLEQIKKWKGLIRESINIRKNGSPFPVWLMSEIVKNAEGEPYAIVTSCEDISERKRAEEALREAEAKFHSIFENAIEGIFQTTPDGHFLSANPALARIHGYDSPEEFLASITDIGEQLYIKPDDRKMFRRMLEEKGQIIGFETQQYCKNGNVIWVSISARSTFDNQGNLLFYEGTLIDITARKRAEEDLRKYQEHLEELVKERTAEVTAANKQLQQEISERRRAEEELKRAKEVADAANKAKSEFLTNMSHELRTPLNAILGYTQILNRDKSLAKKQKDAIGTIHHSSEHLLAMINELLDLSRIEARKVELEPTDIYLPGFLKGIVEIARIRAQQEGVPFDCEIATDLPTGVHADEKRLRQVLLNLLNNAIKFTEEGKVTFKVRNNRLRDEATPVPSQEGKRSDKSLTTSIHFQVQDTGYGIPSDKIEDIFVPFHRAHNTRFETEGTGLGLPISRELIQIMDSKLHVKSVVGQGTTVWFDLELPKVEGVIAGEAKQSRHAVGFKGERRKILIADDTNEVRTVLRDMLSPLGFEIGEAVDGWDAVAKATTFYPDLILIDLMMPMMDGFEVTRHIRQIHELKGVIVIGISGTAFDTTIQESLKAGCDDFLAKPIYLDDLLEKLRVHLKLEWMHEEHCEIQTIKTQLEQRPIVPPSAEKLAALYEWTVIGDIESILEYVKKIEIGDSAFAPFAIKARQFAETFLLDELEEFIKQYMD